MKIKLRDCTKVCQNCIQSNNKRGKYIHIWRRKDSIGEQGFWHIWCEKRKKYYRWDKIKLCYYVENRGKDLR